MGYKTRLVRSSQDTFLRRYKFNTETSLKSSSTAERIVPDRYYYVEASDRQSLTTASKNTNEPTILPHIFFMKRFGKAGAQSKNTHRNQRLAT